MLKSKRLRWFFAGSLILFIGVFFYFDLQRYVTWGEFNRQRELLEDLCHRHPFLTKGVYFLIYLFTAGLSLPTTAILTLIGGALFGLVWGVLLVSFASTMGATVSFIIVRFLFRDFFYTKFNKDIKGFLNRFEKEGAWYLLSLRIVPLMPFFLTNILMGFTNLPVRVYALVSQVGMLPGTIVYVNAGSQLSQVDSPKGLLSLPIIISLFLLALFPLIAKKLLEHIKKSSITTTIN